MDSAEIEKIRATFKPTPVRFLMVGESPPPSGHFFYDPGEERIFTSITRKAFTKAFDIDYDSAADFLEDFKRNGFFLDELYSTPVDNIPSSERETERRNAVSRLSERLRQYQPQRLLVFTLQIEDDVREAVVAAELDVIIERSYYMGQFYQYEYHAGLVGWFSDIRNKFFTAQ